MSQAEQNVKPPVDRLLTQIADYVMNYRVISADALTSARLCLADSVGCAILALSFPACKKLLGPWVSGETITQGARVFGTDFELDPIKAAFDIGTMIRWLDYNDTWLAKEWGHPSDNLGAILSVADFLNRRNLKTVRISDVLHAMIKAYEIQGVLALGNSFNAQGLDHVILVKLASCAVVTQMMGGTQEQIVDAMTQVMVDGQSLRTYRHAPNAGSRKSWAAGDATSRAVRLAMLTLQGEGGYPSCISAERWGFSAVLFDHKAVELVQPLGSYVMENILFKIAFPAEFHAQTAVECAFALRKDPQFNLANIQRIEIQTHDSAIRIISKTGPLHNPADRDHCLQYMVAVALITGELTAQSYEDSAANDSRIDKLRDLMVVSENQQFSADYHHPDKRSIANTVILEMKDGQRLSQTFEYPVGHKRRRAEGVPLLWEKFEQNIQDHYKKLQVETITCLMRDDPQLLSMTVSDWIDRLHR